MDLGTARASGEKAYGNSVFLTENKEGRFSMLRSVPIYLPAAWHHVTLTGSHSNIPVRLR
jgi:hypothetical protein